MNCKTGRSSQNTDRLSDHIYILKKCVIIISDSTSTTIGTDYGGYI